MSHINASETTIRATAAALGRAALFDDRITEGDPARIGAWSEVIEPHKLDTATLLAAVDAFYNDNPNARTIQVADLIRHGRNMRRERAEREKAAEITSAAPPNLALGGLPIPTDGDPVWGAYEVNEAITRPCPRCGAQPDEACWNRINGRPSRVPCLIRLTGKDRVA